MRTAVRLFAALSAAAAVSVTASEAAIVELSMTAAVNNTTHTEVHPYLAPGDIATLTVRYDTDTAATGPHGTTTFYQNAITYFSFELERGGATTYSGSVSGNFGQVSVSNDTGPGGAYDAITFRIFDDVVDYPSGTRTGTTPAPDLALMPTGDPIYGDLLFHDFRMHFLTVDNTVLSSEALPTLADLAIAGGGSPFAPRSGNTPWSGDYQSENWTQVLGGFGTFGPGTYRDSSPYDIDFTVREYIDSDVSEVPLPAAAPLFGLGLAGFAGLRRRKASK
ncbi:VPLPA-CTERM sorting domain-containing protein [Hyphococcus sp.]|uniref:VPLPA-CTERM sorting domain-containing protein n=1 Tax=Hyphococcus sp. TaxID=2038636 RepID=UPI0035C6E462